MAFGDLAQQDGYDPDAAEVAALRLRRGVVGRQQGKGAERSERIMGGLADLSMALGQPFTDLTDASHAAMGTGPMTEQEAFLLNNTGKSVAQMGALALGRNPFGAVPSQAVLRGGQLNVVPVADARALGIKASVAPGGLIERAVKGTPGTAIDEGMLRMPVIRGQRPEQEMMDSVRGGVFYLPETDAARRYLNVYKKGGTGPGLYYGGPQIVSGETAFANPLLAKGATGGKVPEAAYAQIMNDKKAMKGLDEATREAMNYAWMNQGVGGIKQLDMVERFLSKHAPELTDNAADILRNSTKGNTLRYALQEAAIGSAARKAGHDAIVGYTETRTRPAKFSEVFDVRERSYPSPSGDFDVWPRDMFGGLARQDVYKP